MNNKSSETITENLFRSLYGVKTFIEKSAIPTQYGFTSKKGTSMQGYPDFFSEKTDYAIIVEAKATNHLTAINEVQYYMLNNKITKDLIGIAVSGQSKNKLKFSYFIKLHNEKQIKSLSDDNCFIKINDIEKIYKKYKYGDSISVENLKKSIKRFK